MINNIKQLIKRFPSVQNLVNLYKLSKPQLDLIYKESDLNETYYQKVKISGDKEMEHQIGRIHNYKQIITEIEQQNIPGDIIEFGTWQGFSLLWILFLLERAGIFNKKTIGVDSFKGLPNSEGIFEKGAFSDTSKEVCLRNIRNCKNLYPSTKQNVYIEDYHFSNKNELLASIRKVTTKKFCFIHIDSDISSSLLEVETILKDGDLIADTCYILFDDYGCMDSYKKTVDQFINDLRKIYTITEHSKTNLTKNYLLKKTN